MMIMVDNKIITINKYHQHSIENFKETYFNKFANFNFDKFCVAIAISGIASLNVRCESVLENCNIK